MGELPEGFAEDLARVIEPSDRMAAAEIIEAATLLDDVGLAHFLRLFAARVKASGVPITGDELRRLLQRAAAGA